MKLSSQAAFAGGLLVFASLGLADVVGTRTITDAVHFGYFGFASTSANNTKTTVGPFNGVARVIRAQGTITKVHPDAWAKSIRVLPSGGGLAAYQPWFQFSDLYDFTGTIPVSATIWAPGGVTLSPTAMLWEMYSIDSEAFVPGIDARSTITYTFDDAYPPNTVEFSGVLSNTDPTFNRPVQVETNPPGYSAPFLTNRFPHYDVQLFHVDAPGRYALVTANEFYSSMVLYAGSFDPQNSLSNIVRALGQTGNVLRSNAFNGLPINGDATGGTVINADLLPGVQYYMVTTAFAAPGTSGGPYLGRYTNLISGPGGVNLGLVPEPSVIGAFTLVGATLLRRRR